MTGEGKRGALDPRLLRHSRATRPFVLACVLLGLVGTAAVLAQAALLARTITAVFLGGADLAAVAGDLGLLAAVVALRAAIAFVEETLAARAGVTVTSQLRSALMRHSLAIGPGWRAGRRTGELAQLATRGVDAVEPYIARYLPQLVLTCLVPPMVLVVIWATDWVSGLVVLVTLPVVVVFLVLIGMASRHRSQRQWRSLARLSHHFLDVVDGLPTLRVFGRAQAQQRSIVAVTEEYRRTTMGVLRLAFLSSFVLELAGSLAVALVAVQIGLRLLSGDIPLEAGLLVLLLAPDVYLPLRRLGAAHHAAEEGGAAVAAVLDVLDTAVPPRGERTVPDVARYGLEVRGLAVADRLAPVSLDLAPGELVALTGQSGVGKSTLLAVLLGFLRPDAGAVRVAGADVGEADLEVWRTQVAWAPQRAALLAGTVADNVRLGAPDASDADVAAALDLAACDLDPRAVLGEDGAGLSAGERARVALARAALRALQGAGLLLLDEPTAHLDGPTRQRVLAGLRRLAVGRCVLLVVHDPALADAADRVVELGAGSAAHEVVVS